MNRQDRWNQDDETDVSRHSKLFLSISRNKTSLGQIS
ncbi:hypothetical protein LINPERPRIM_LOCUS4746, partial [Linum perenne]